MAHREASRRRPPVWFLVGAGAAAAGVAGWFVARTRRDRLVAEAGEVLHEDAAAVAAGQERTGEDPAPGSSKH